MYNVHPLCIHVHLEAMNITYVELRSWQMQSIKISSYWIGYGANSSNKDPCKVREV